MLVKQAFHTNRNFVFFGPSTVTAPSTVTI